MSVVELLNKINRLVINPLILLLFAIAFLVFMWGVFQFIQTETADSKRSEGQKKIIYGVVGMFIMVSAKGIIFLILSTFGINNASLGYPFH